MSENIHTIKEVMEVIQKINKLQNQIDNPNRTKIIEALREAQVFAPFEIRMLEIFQGDIKLLPPENFSNDDLYRKLFQYKQGLINYCIQKIGNEAYKSLFEKNL
ncbi:hypothetical protein H3N56_11450 [Cetobacterium sp. 2A]|nr:hypothetical protein [Cetobacterium sp. 2A]